MRGGKDGRSCIRIARRMRKWEEWGSWRTVDGARDGMQGEGCRCLEREGRGKG
jgi:hypothetical protein